MPEGFLRYNFRPSTPLLLFRLSDVPLTYFIVLCIFQNLPIYSSVPPTPENPMLPANPDELPSASSRHDLDDDEESLEGGDAESSSSACSCAKQVKRAIVHIIKLRAWKRTTEK